MTWRSIGSRPPVSCSPHYHVYRHARIIDPTDKQPAGRLATVAGRRRRGIHVETQLVATFGSYEAEYAVIRKGVGICHEPQRGLLQLVGADVKDFLHRMVTQDVNGMAGGASRRSLQVNVKGRIVADFVIHHGDVDTWIDTDATDLPQLEQLWDSRLFGEDREME